VHATGPHGIRVEQVNLDGRPMLCVTMRGVLVGRGHYATVAEALRALARIGIEPDDLEFDYSDPAPPDSGDPACE
jgi:hypothetical protein